MTKEKAGIAQMLLNTYAHLYLDLSPDDVLVAAGEKYSDWFLIIGLPDGAKTADSFDEGKTIIDQVSFMERPENGHD